MGLAMILFTLPTSLCLRSGGEGGGLGRVGERVLW